MNVSGNQRRKQCTWNCQEFETQLLLGTAGYHKHCQCYDQSNSC